VADEIVDAIARGEAPAFAADDEALVYDFARQLVVGGRVDHDTYARAAELLGNQGVVELVSLCGYYTLISFTLNAFTVPLPPGAEPVWGE
jgi:4-carboxymuconolactone decarboxylase